MPRILWISGSSKRIQYLGIVSKHDRISHLTQVIERTLFSCSTLKTVLSCNRLEHLIRALFTLEVACLRIVQVVSLIQGASHGSWVVWASSFFGLSKHKQTPDTAGLSLSHSHYDTPGSQPHHHLSRRNQRHGSKVLLSIDFFFSHLRICSHPDTVLGCSVWTIG